jgi:hypothetical protein
VVFASTDDFRCFAILYTSFVCGDLGQPHLNMFLPPLTLEIMLNLSVTIGYRVSFKDLPNLPQTFEVSLIKNLRLENAFAFLCTDCN